MIPQTFQVSAVACCAIQVSTSPICGIPTHIDELTSGCLYADNQHILHMLQSSAQELAAMEATLVVLRNGLRNSVAPEAKNSDATVNLVATDRQPLQPLGNFQRQGSHPEVCCWFDASTSTARSESRTVPDWFLANKPRLTCTCLKWHLTGRICFRALSLQQQKNPHFLKMVRRFSICKSNSSIRGSGSGSLSMTAASTARLLMRCLCSSSSLS